MLLSSCKAVQNTVSKLESTKFGNTSSNLQSHGWTAQDEGNLYFAVFDDNGKHLYKSDLDGKNKKELAQVDYTDLNAMNGWLYYINDYHIYKVDKNGENNQKISDIEVIFLLAYDEKLYVATASEQYNNNLYVMDVDGENVKLLSDDMTSIFDLYNDNIFYVTHSPDNTNDVLYQIDLNGTNKKEVFKFGDIRWFGVHNDTIYYRSLFGKPRKISLSDVGNIDVDPLGDSSGIISANISDNNLYYFDMVNSQFHILNLNDDKEKVIDTSPGEYYNIYVHNNKLYHYVDDQLFQANSDGSNDRLFLQ